MRLNETEMVKLLPAWMQEDGSDKGLAAGCDIVSRDAYARLKLLSRWDKIDQLSDAELDEMAWELNIQWYDSTAPIAAKRAVIRNSDRVYSKLGTPYAVEQIVADYFGTGEVREWYQYGGQPHHFKVLSDNPSLVNSNLDLFLKLLRTVKRRSSCYASAVLAIAAAEIGYHEKKSNSQLDNPTANAGSANYTKYARDFDEKYPKWYNGKKNGFAWCDMFVDWCMLTAFGYADALRLLCQPERSAGAGCTYSLMYYEKQGRYHAKDPKPGDQIFFSTAHSKSNVSHTGLVEKVDGSKVYTIEGNTSDQVARRSYYLSDNYIVGYGRPAYDAEPGNANTGSQTPSGGTTSEVTYTVVAGDTLSKIAAKYGTTYQKLAAYNGITNPNIIRVGQKIKIPGTAAPKKTIAEIAKEVIAGKWGNGADRKKRLEAAGYDYNAVQQAVNAALAR